MKKLLSILLSLALIFSAMSVLGGIGFTASAATTDNLLPNPNWDYTYDEATGKYSVNGWKLASIATISTDDDGSNVITIDALDTNKTYDIYTANNLNIDRNSYYKFSIMYKLEDPSSGEFYIPWNVWLAFRYNGKNVNRVKFEKNFEWTEASFIIYGGNMA